MTTIIPLEISVKVRRGFKHGDRIPDELIDLKCDIYVDEKSYELTPSNLEIDIEECLVFCDSNQYITEYIIDDVLYNHLKEKYGVIVRREIIWK